MYPQKPSHNLETAKQLVKEGKYHISGRALRFLVNRYGDIDVQSIIAAVVCSIQKENFFKSDELKKKPGVYADIYKEVRCAEYPEEEWYVKMLVTPDGAEVAIWSMNWDGYIH